MEFEKTTASVEGPGPTEEDVRSIGDILRSMRELTSNQVGEILAHQRSYGVKFGEAAIALGYVSMDDVLRALAEQFNYAYGDAESERANPELVTLHQPFGHQAEAFRAIRAQIMLRTDPSEAAGAPKVKRALAVVSPNTGDGKTFFCANLGIALAQLGGRTLVVDGDLRGPRLHELFSVQSNSGMAGLLSGRRGESVVRAVKGVSNLFVMPVGIRPPNPLELLQGPAFGMLLREVLAKFDHVVVDTPAGQYGADAVVAAARCGAALVVARRDVSQLGALQEMVQNLATADVKLAGVVMNEF
jgi:chain length determinant protein tyrosine kinase EpsG